MPKLDGMPSYQVYIPNVTGADPQHLVRAGLDILDPHAAPTAVDAIPGPDGGRGVIFYWPHGIDDYNPQPGYHPETQEWSQVQSPKSKVQTLDIGPSTYNNCPWLGRDLDKAVEPESLLRRRHLAGTMLELADGLQWLIPAAPMLPQRLGIDESGKVARNVQPRYQAYWDQVVHYYEQFLALGDLFDRQIVQSSDSQMVADHPTIRPSDDPTASMTLERAWPFAVETLALNYRVDATIVSWLGLLDEATIFALILRTFEGDLVRLQEAVKKKRPSPSPAVKV